jgi:uncharacterized protein YutE (UPF0331/DUF86 family)
VANHIIASERYRSPKDYADSFAVLEEKGIFQQQLGQNLMQMTKFRNRLVHLYGEIDDQFVYFKQHQRIFENLNRLTYQTDEIINFFPAYSGFTFVPARLPSQKRNHV